MLDVNTTNEGDVLPIIRKKERDYMGMFEYDRRDEMQIIRVLVYGKLKIETLVRLDWLKWTGLAYFYGYFFCFFMHMFLMM